MLLPSPETQKRLKKYATHDPIEAEALAYERRRQKRRHAALNRTLATIALLAAGTSAYVHDVEENKTVQAEASIAIQVEGQALDETNNDNALIFIDGFGSYNANTLTNYMSKAIQPVIDGQLWSVDYNNAPLETIDIAKNIIETALKQNVTSISLVGYSAGGDVAMQVQEEIHQASDLDIESITLISTPDGAQALRPARRDEIDLVEKFAWIPGIQYSTPLRFLGELAFRADRYNTGPPIDRFQHFVSTATHINDSLNRNKLPGTWLMFDQMLAIEHADLEKRISTMEDIPEDQIRPVIIYLGTAKPGYDYMVNDDKSSDDIGSYADKANIPFLSYDVPGAVHARIDIANDQYIKTLGDAATDIQSSIRDQKESADLHRITGMYMPVIPTESPE